jgi:hypothetical protein
MKKTATRGYTEGRSCVIPRLYMPVPPHGRQGSVLGGYIQVGFTLKETVCRFFSEYFYFAINVLLCFIIVSVYTICATDMYTIRFSFTTGFGLMWPSSGTLGITTTYFFSCCSPHTGQCLHIGSALYVWFLCDVLCCETYWILNI